MPHGIFRKFLLDQLAERLKLAAVVLLFPRLLSNTHRHELIGYIKIPNKCVSFDRYKEPKRAVFSDDIYPLIETETPSREGCPSRRDMTEIENHPQFRIWPENYVCVGDLLPMSSMPGTQFIQGNFRERSVFRELQERVKAKAEQGQVNVVISDISPNFSGIKNYFDHELLRALGGVRLINIRAIHDYFVFI